MSRIDAVVADLRTTLAGERVRTGDHDLVAAGHDTWPVSTKLARLDRHPNPPDVVAVARDEADVTAVLRVATAHDVPVTVRALASSVTGQPLPTRGGIVLDVSEIPPRWELDEQDMTVRASASQPGGALEDALQERGWTLGHSPQSLYRSTVGGWLATMATGQFSSYYGGIEDLVVGYTVLLATGERIHLTASPRAAMGPDLRTLFLGSEGTLGVIVDVELKAFPLPGRRLLDAVELPDVSAGVAVLREQAAAGLRPFLLRLYDPAEARHALQDPQAERPVVFVGTQGDERVARAEMDVLQEILARHGGRSLGPGPAERWMGRRFDFSTVEKLLDTDGGYAETIEVAHRWSGIEALHSELRATLEPLADEVLGHFSHSYPQGTSLYMILLGHADDDEDAVRRLGTVWREAMRVCLEHGAELSHHHGGGLARSAYARESLGGSHALLRRLKAALDPNGTLNPGKLGL